MLTKVKKLAIFLFVFAPFALLCGKEKSTLLPGRQNIALGKPYTFSIQPNYTHKGNPMCTEQGDSTQLTDGELSEFLWLDKRAVGIRTGTKRTVDITIDLGESKPIGSVVAHTMARYQAGVAFPLEIRVFVSDDKDNKMRLAGRLKTGSVMTPSDWRKRYQTFTLDKLAAKGRYVTVSFVATGGGKCVFLDEIQIFPPDNESPEKRKESKLYSSTELLPFYRDSVAYVSPDMTMPFQVMLPKGGKVKDLEISLPESVRIAESPAYKIKEKSSEGNYTKYKLDGRKTHHYAMTHIFLETSRKDGDAGIMKLKLGSSEQEILLKTVRIRKNLFPSRIIASSGWNSVKFYENWPGFKKNWRRMGLNTVTVGWHDILMCKKDKKKFEHVSKLVKDFVDSGFYVVANNSPGAAWWANHVREKQPELRQFVDQHGKKHKYVCPYVYKQLRFKDDLDNALCAVRLGMSYFWLDYEPAWHGPCFCEYCRRRFAGFQKEHYPELKQIDQFEIVKAPKRYPEQYRAFQEYQIDFGRKIFGELYRAPKLEAQRLKVNSGPSFQVGYYAVSPGSGEIRPPYFQFDNFYWTGIADFAMPDLYTTPTYFIGDRLKKYRLCLKGQDLIPWLSTGAGGLELEKPAVQTKYMLLESLCSGSKGFTFFTVHGFDGLDWKYLADALAMLIPLEDIIAEGKPLDDEFVSCKNARTLSTIAPGGIMVYVTDYGLKKKKIVRLEMLIEFDGEVADAETGKILYGFKRGKNSFDIKLTPGNPVRLLYFGRPGEAAKRKLGNLEY